MSDELNTLLQAALKAEPPEWLDRLVTDRVVSVVQAETASSGAPPLRDGARARSKPSLSRGRSPAAGPRMRALSARVARAWLEVQAVLRALGVGFVREPRGGFRRRRA